VLDKADTFPGEVQYQHLDLWLQHCLVLSSTRVIKEISLNLEQRK